MDLDQRIDAIVAEFKKDPRNKVFLSQEILLASAEEETGKKVSADELRSLIKQYEEGSITDEDLEAVDGALYACGVVARRCFGETPDDEEEDVDFETTFLENSDGTYSAEIRPS